jgi:hypothetical protein
MFVRMAADNSPENTFETIFPACHIAIRKGLSSLVYQLDVMSATTGRKGPSVKPTRNRQSMKCHGFVAAGIQIVTADQASIMQGIHILGFCFAMMMLAGICDMM